MSNLPGSVEISTHCRGKVSIWNNTGFPPANLRRLKAKDRDRALRQFVFRTGASERAHCMAAPEQFHGKDAAHVTGRSGNEDVAPGQHPFSASSGVCRLRSFARALLSCDYRFSWILFFLLILISLFFSLFPVSWWKVCAWRVATV